VGSYFNPEHYSLRHIFINVFPVITPEKSPMGCGQKFQILFQFALYRQQYISGVRSGEWGPQICSVDELRRVLNYLFKKNKCTSLAMWGIAQSRWNHCVLKRMFLLRKILLQDFWTTRIYCRIFCWTSQSSDCNPLDLLLLWDYAKENV